MPASLRRPAPRITPSRQTRRGRTPDHRLHPLEPRTLLAAAVVNWNDVRQTIDGFGASTAWMWGSINATALAQLYSPATGAGLSLLRSRIAPYGGSSEWEAMQQAAAYGVRSWSTPWTPPREWKTNFDTANGGSLDPAHYQDYANHLSDYVQDMANKGIPLYAVSLQNEPNWTADYESCRWTAAQFAAFLPYIGQTFAARGITGTKIMLPESLNWDFSLASTIMANATLSQYVGILAAHNYGESGASYQPVTIAAGKPVWETEISSFASTELAQAIDIADDVAGALNNGGASAYHYWWLSSSGPSALTENWVPTKRLWAMGQYSKFVRPGWVRIGQTNDGGLDIVTFKDPVSGKFAFVVTNTSTSNTVTEQFTLNGFTASSVTPWVTSASDNLAGKSAITLANGSSFSYAIAPSSIVTFYGQSAGFPTILPVGNLYAAGVYNNMSTQIVLSWADRSSAESAYTVERSTNGTTWTVVTTTLAANAIGYTDTGRTENTRYYYRVKPTNGDVSTYSPIISAATILKAQNFWNFSGTRTGSGINLTWNFDSAGATGTTLQRSLDGVTWTNIATLTTRATSYLDTIAGYSPAQIYFYRLRNAAGGNSSSYTLWNTGLATPTLTTPIVSPYGIKFSWSSPTLGTFGAWIEQNINGSWTRISPNNLRVSAGSWTLNGLQPNTAYSFRFRTSAQGDNVYSSYTATVARTTPPAPQTPYLWYKANQSAGPALADAAYGNDAALAGSYAFTPGMWGNDVSLTGGYAALPNSVVAGLTDFTIATWINVSTLATWARVFDFGSGSTANMFLTARANGVGGPLRFAITTSGGGGEQRLTGPVLAANTWYHVAITLNSVTDVATMYVNGQSVATGTMSLTPAALGATTQNYIGKSQYGADPNFSGAIDDFRIYARTLSAGEVRQIAARPGDANADGNVDLGDFDIWFANVSSGTANGPAAGDLDYSGVVDLGDFDLWLSHVGSVAAPLASGVSASEVIAPAPAEALETVAPASLNLLVVPQTHAAVPQDTLIGVVSEPAVRPAVRMAYYRQGEGDGVSHPWRGWHPGVWRWDEVFQQQLPQTVVIGPYEGVR